MIRKVSICAAFILLLALPGCLPDKSQQELMKWRITLDKEDKGPYGAYLASQSLKYYFPGVPVQLLSRGFRYSNMDDKMMYSDNGHALLVLTGLDFYVSGDEWNELKQFVHNGNELVIFCSLLDSRIEQELGCYKEHRNAEEREFYSLTTANENNDVLDMVNDSVRRYSYHGRSLAGYFSFTGDSVHHPDKTTNTENEHNIIYRIQLSPDTLGYANDMPDLIRYKIGTGHLTLHAAPLVLSNYFLLQNGNENYMTALWQLLPQNINRVYWNDYYVRSGQSSKFDVLWRYPATRWALLLGIFALLVYILFEGKRKQRIIPVVEPLKNDSVSFVETVGRLYYNKGNHTNLAGKMTQQFLEWVRTHYFLNTNLLNDSFIQQLTIKSGQPEATVRGLLDMIHEIKLGDAKTDDAYLYQLYNTMQQFYNTNKK